MGKFLNNFLQLLHFGAALLLIASNYLLITAVTSEVNPFLSLATSGRFSGTVYVSAALIFLLGFLAYLTIWINKALK